MPIDLNGNPVEVGDVVNVAFVVKEAWGDDNFCNLILEPVESMPGSGTRQVESFNSRQVVKTPASTPVPASNVGREETGPAAAPAFTLVRGVLQPVNVNVAGTAAAAPPVTIEPVNAMIQEAPAEEAQAQS